MIKLRGKYLSVLEIRGIHFACSSIRLLESGILQQWHTNVEYMHGKHVKSYNNETNSLALNTRQSLILDNLVSAFYFLLAGLFLSFLVFIIEIYVKYTRAPINCRTINQP